MKPSQHSTFDIQRSTFKKRGSVPPSMLNVFRLIVLALALATVIQAHAEVFASHLQCEYAVHPFGIDVPNPRLSWQLQSAKRGEVQTAYQILVASSPGLMTEEKADLWNSGKVNSDEALYVHYSGKKLNSSQDVFWKVRVWDRTGDSSEWSSVSQWTMGIIPPKEAASQDAPPAGWKARWICAQSTSEALLLRKEFQKHVHLLIATETSISLFCRDMRLMES